MMTVSEPGYVLNAAYLKSLLDYLRAQGILPDELFGTDEVAWLDQLGRDERVGIAHWCTLLSTAQRHLPGKSIALEIASFLKPQDTGAFGFIAMASSSLQEAIGVVTRYFHLLNDAYTLNSTLDEHGFRIDLAPTGRQRFPQLELYTLGILCGHARALTGRPGMRFQAALAFACPDDAPWMLAGCEQVFGEAPRFGQMVSSLHGPADYAGYAIAKNDFGIGDALRQQLQDRMASLNGQSGHALHKIEQALTARLERGEVALEDVAKEVGMPVRTLQNRLKASGLNYRQVLDRCRHAQALLYLNDPDLGLIHIAQMLGFTTQSSFHHAFKRWTGVAPRQYRQHKKSLGNMHVQGRPPTTHQRIP
ncbi:AraC family transcriptional regulator ligand-binding domain-containing protein [Aquabacterium sp.]|uniref:AraC family transcriptional regulator ligand-binding domain-containing protein n=1 Tax=Aquabacterium sp. TaxID=1872578 RepID=UPI0040379252